MKFMTKIVALLLLSLFAVLPAFAQSGVIGVEQALAIVAPLVEDTTLEEADLRFRQTTGLVWHLEYHNGMEFILNATTGEVLSQQLRNDDATDDFSAVAVDTDAIISQIRAQYGDVAILKLELDDEDGRAYWEIWLESGIKLEIDANTSQVNERTRDDSRDDNTSSAALITAEEALAIALTVYPSASVDEIELDDDDDQLIWEVDFDNDRVVDIDARTGAILGFSFDDDRDGRDDNDDRDDDRFDDRDDDDDRYDDDNYDDRYDDDNYDDRDDDRYDDRSDDDDDDRYEDRSDDDSDDDRDDDWDDDDDDDRDDDDDD